MLASYDLTRHIGNAHTIYPIMETSIFQRRPRILKREPAVFRPDIIDYFIKDVIPKSKVLLDPMAGTAPLIPAVEHIGLKAYFNDILPLHYYVNLAKTYKVYNAVKTQRTYLKRELNRCLKKLKDKRLVMSEKWIRDDILDGLLYAWHKFDNYERTVSIFFKAVTILCVRSYSGVSSSTNPTWNKIGGVSTEKELSEIINDNIEKYFAYYNKYYSVKNIIRGGRCNFIVQDARTLTLKDKVDTVITSPPFANRYDYVRLYAPELYFLSKTNDKKAHDSKKLNEVILATNMVADYQEPRLDLEHIGNIAPKTREFLARVESTGEKKKKERQYYLRYFTKFYINLYSIIENTIKLMKDNAEFYIVVQNNIHRGEVNEMSDLLIDYFSNRGISASKVFRVPRSHQGRRNISAEHPLVLRKHYETIVRAII